MWIYYGVILRRGYGALHVCAALLFLIYCSGVLSVCGSVTATDVLIIPAELRGNVNLIPLSGADRDELLLNVLLYVPFGFLLPLIFNDKERFAKIVLYALVFSVSVEAGQLFKFRAVDVNDLIANASGAASGALLALPFLKFAGNFIDKVRLYRGEKQRLLKFEPLVLLVFAYALRFFADPAAVKFIIWLSGYR